MWILWERSKERDRYKKEWEVRMNESIVLLVIIIPKPKSKAKDPVHQNPIS